MIKLIQFPWSTYCIVTRRVAQFGNVPLQIVNIPPLDRSLAWNLSGGRSYRVPLLDDDGHVVVEESHDTQVIARYLDEKFKLGLFPAEYAGVQSILWRYIENDVEDPAFRLNDIYYEEWVPEHERLNHLQYKERRFGAGCIQQWKTQQAELTALLIERLRPFEAMLAHRPFLLGERPYFVDLDLAAMLDSYLTSGHYEIPNELPMVRQWFDRLNAARSVQFVSATTNRQPGTEAEMPMKHVKNRE